MVVRLGSRYSNVNPNNANFGVYNVNDGNVNANDLVNSDNGENDWDAGVRPLDSKKTVFMYTKVA